MNATELKNQQVTEKPKPAWFVVQHDGDRKRISYQQLFAAGHSLWLNKKYEHAAQVFQTLTTVTDRGPRAHIMLAHCKAMLSDYKECSAILHQALGNSRYGNAASELHDAFVYWKVGLPNDLKEMLVKIVSKYPQLPTPCLILADFLASKGSRKRSSILLRQAIERDRSDGAIALISRGLLSDAQTKNAERGINAEQTVAIE